MNVSYTNVFRFFFALVDLVLINIIHLSLLFFLPNVPGLGDRNYTVLFIVSNMIWLGSAYMTGLYINDQDFNHERFAKRTIQSFAIFIGLLLTFMFFQHFYYSRRFISANLLLIGGMLFFTRIIFSTIYLKSNPMPPRPKSHLSFSSKLQFLRWRIIR